MYKVDIFTDKLEYASFAMIDGNQNIELDYLAFDAYTIETRLIECKKGYFVHITEDNEFVCDGIVSDVKPDKATQQISIKPIQTMFDEEVFYSPVNDAITWLATNINNTYLNNADTYQNRPINLTYTTYSESFPLTGFNLHETINILSVMISALKTHGVVVDCSLDLPNKHINVDIHKSDSVVRETTVSEIEVYDGQITTTRYYYAYLLNSDSQAQPARTICTNVINAINNYPNARRFVKVTINGTEFIKEYIGTSTGDPGYYDFGNSYFDYSDLGVNDISFHFSNRPSEWALAALVYNTSGPYVNKTINIKVTFYATQNADFSIDPLHIRADLDNVIESSVTLGDSYGSKNKAEIQKTKTVDDETTYHGVTNFYLHNDGTIDSTNSNRVWPVFRSIENLQQDDDMTDQDWTDAALARAKEILEPQKYDNEIMLTYSKYDKLIHPNDIQIGREVIIYLKGNTYASVLTGKRIKGNEITLIFGVVRTEFTKKLSIEEREKLTFQNTVSAVMANVAEDYPTKSAVADGYVKKTGDTMTGTLVNKSNYEQRSTIVLNTPPSVTSYYPSYRFLDTNGAEVGTLHQIQDTAGNIGVQLEASPTFSGQSRRYNNVRLWVNKDGTFSVHLSHPSEWLTALGLQPSAISATITSNVASAGSYNRYYRIGRLVVLTFNLNLKAATSAGTIYVQGLPIPLGGSVGFSLARSAAANRFYIANDGTMRNDDGNIPATWYNGSVTYISAS